MDEGKLQCYSLAAGSTATNDRYLSARSSASFPLQEQEKRLLHHSPDVALDALYELIDTYAGYEKDWDSYGAPPFHPTVLERTKDLVTDLSLLGIPSPNLIPASSGSIILEWRTQQVHLEIDIDPERDDSVYISGQAIAGEIEYFGPLNDLPSGYRRKLNRALCCLMYTENKTLNQDT